MMALEDAFDAWYLREHPRVLTSLVAISGDVAIATDATDEAFARAYEHWGRVAAMDSPGGWTYRTGLNLVRRRFRRQALERRLLRRVAGSNRGSRPPVDWSIEVWEALGRLPQRERTAIVLRHVGDLPVADIAHAMHVAPGTVASSLHAGRARLAQFLAEPTEVNDG